MHGRRTRAATSIQAHVRGAIVRHWDLPSLVQHDSDVSARLHPMLQPYHFHFMYMMSVLALDDVDEVD